jgi:hypothetical protein
VAVAQGRAYFFGGRRDFVNVPGFVVEASEALSIRQPAHVDTVNEINRIAREQCASCFSASYGLITKLSQYFAH